MSTRPSTGRSRQIAITERIVFSLFQLVIKCISFMSDTEESLYQKDFPPDYLYIHFWIINDL